MIEIRFHGRGGQGTVVASKILANVIFAEGKYSQSFPSFGVERRGAPVAAFLRVDDKPIRIRTEIYEPDHIIILDPLLVDQIPLTNGLKTGGLILINSNKSPSEYQNKFSGYGIATVPASRIAFKHQLGAKQSPIVNTAILGAVVKMLGIATLEGLLKTIKSDVPSRSEENAAAAREAYTSISEIFRA